MTIISGGTVVGADGAYRADVVIDGERIAAVVAEGYGEGFGSGDVDRIDATGMYVIPGGVDVHTHLQLPVGAYVSSDDFETGTIAAAHGGVTTIIDFVTQSAGEQVLDTLAARHAEAAGRCAIDYGFHQIIGGVDDDSLAAMADLVTEGITTVKLFMAYPGRLYSDDGQILRAMQRADELGLMVMMHAENGLAIDVLVAQALARGDTAPRFHSLTRPSVLEGEATNRAVQLARVAGGVPLYIVHMSASEALDEVAEARHRGQNVFAETCPHYLYLTLEDQLAGPDGAGFICSTPLRSRDASHRADLWKGLRMDELAVVSTDHCPFCLNERAGADFASVPNGIGGIEHRMELIYQGVVTGELSLERWVETCCTTPARLFGLWPRKGVIAPGADADIVIWDPTATTTIGIGHKHHMAVDYSAFEGMVIDGAVRTVLSRGAVIVDGDRFTGRVGHGRYLARDVSPLWV